MRDPATDRSAGADFHSGENMAKTNGWANIAHVFRNPAYRIYQTGRFSSQVTIWMYRVTVGWIVWDYTHSSTWLGVFGFLDQACALVVSPLAGAMADRMNPVKFMRLTQALMFLQALGLAALMSFDLLNLWTLAVFVVIYGIGNGAQQPVNQTILPAIVPKEDLTTVYGLNSMGFNLSRFIGPMIAGFIISEFGTGPAVSGNVIGAAIYSICLAMIKPVEALQKKKRAAATGMLAEIREGFVYACRHTGIAPMMAVLTVLSLFPFTINLMLPSLADGVYHQGAQGLASMTAALGVGATVTGLYLARRGEIAGLTNTFVLSILGMGVAYVALAVSSWYVLGLVCAFFVGFTTIAVRSGSFTLLQYSVQADMRGRVSSFYSMIYTAGPAVGAPIVGVIADQFGVPASMGVIGVVTLAVWVWAKLQSNRMAVLELDPERDAVKP